MPEDKDAINTQGGGGRLFAVVVKAAILFTVLTELTLRLRHTSPAVLIS